MLVEAVLGNVMDEDWKDRLVAAQVDTLRLDQWEAQKNRLRKQTDGGREIALSLHRGTRLRDGDILDWHEERASAVVASIELGEVMVVDVDTSAATSTEEMVRAAIELGHALGNQHWPAVVKGTTVYVPLTVDRKVMASVMKTHDLPGVSYHFVPGTEVIAYMAPHEARRTAMPQPDSGAAIPGALTLLQFGDSMFPVGAFSFSHGLESAVEEGVVHDKDSLVGFVGNAVHQAATGDAIAVLEAHRGVRLGEPARVRRADQAVYVRKLNEEMRTMTVRMGRKLAQAAVHIMPAPGMSSWLQDIEDGTTPGTHPVGLGVAFADLGLSETDAFAAHQYGVAVTMVSAATRLMRLHHLDAQAILFEAGQTATADFERVSAATVDDMSTFAPTGDILAGVHVGSFVRMFMN